jgi:hypothetical protein
MSDLNFTASDIEPAVSATIRQGIAGVKITAGQVVYIDDTDNRRLKLADSSAKASANAAGIAINTAGDKQPIDFVHAGPISTGTAVISVGRVYVLSQTAGGVAHTTSTMYASGNYLTVLGVGTATNELTVKLQVSNAQKP